MVNSGLLQRLPERVNGIGIEAVWGRGDTEMRE